MMKVNYFELASIQTVDAKKVIESIEEDELYPGRKRRKLDNLNVDERILRRKLKNRVAAQTARDRKKAHMEDLETCLARIEKENKFLKKSNQELRSQIHNLNEKNMQLQIRLGLTPPSSPSQDYTCPTINKYQKNDSHIITPSVSDHDHIVIKKEELSSEHASLSVVSQLRNIVLIILVSLVTMCEKNHKLSCYLISKNTKNQSMELDHALKLQFHQQHLYQKNLNFLPNIFLLSQKSLMLTSFYQIQAMSLLARLAQSLSWRLLTQAQMTELMVSSHSALTQKNAWWGSTPKMDPPV
ncbi:uncharacterized protein LOC100210912 [Hydra vulgaris]|uniref:X-box-binding protein 1 n=1 Tax=Hydra vulgaris TaxID=6087 RepID=A0ABM4D797_HYDVU